MARKLRPKSFRQASEDWRRGNVGRAMFDATRRFEQDLLAALEQGGYGEVRVVHLNLYRNLELDGTRLTELAARASMTKQGMQELVDKAEEAGFVTRGPDPKDGRAKVVSFSDRGLRLLDVLHDAINQAEHKMISRIGRAQVELIAQWLRAYADAEE